jgi:hypothetical protein
VSSNPLEYDFELEVSKKMVLQLKEGITALLNMKIVFGFNVEVELLLLQRKIEELKNHLGWDKFEVENEIYP